MVSSAFSFSSNTFVRSTSGILLRVLCIPAAFELIYQIFDLFTNSGDPVYLMTNWYYTFSLISSLLAIPVVFFIWKFKFWAVPVLLTIAVLNQAMWFSFGVWDWTMLIFPCLFIFVWLWHFRGTK